MLLSDRKMELLRKMELKEKTPTELSEEMDLTISSVTKHLKDLEGRGLIKKTGKKSGKTRSYWKYKLEEFVQFLASVDGEIVEGKAEMDETHKVHLRTWSIPQTEFHRPVEKLWCEIQGDLEEVEGIVVYGSVARGDAREDSDVDVLMITDSEKIEEKYGAKVIGEKMFMVKSFTEEEFEKNLENGSNFAKNVIEEGIIIYDPDNILQRWKSDYKG
ncbi:MAG: nucleotidyltransferase domain-containing protein [Candidatus Aenigmatarchaeota archaeon]